MMMLKEIWLIFLSCILRECIAGYCRQAYSCQKTCYTSERYSSDCGLWGWSSCTKYRQKSSSCAGTCYKNVCCDGYRGYKCETPICSTPCRNGGTCIRPNTCSCPAGFSTPYCDDINECSIGRSSCKQLCTNTHGSYTCSCKPGFQLLSDKRTCLDINECSTNKGGCQHMCTNTDGSYKCDCYAGYSLDAASASICKDIDECHLGTSICSHGCVNTLGSYTCSCPQGFVVSRNKTGCEDEDECSRKVCEQTCQNTHGSYKCICSSGYRLLSDGRSCQAVDLCASGNGGCMQICRSSYGIAYCSCKRGWKLNADKKTCDDIDECADGASCRQLCVNTLGSFTCGCRSGFTLAHDNTTCLNNDDCVHNLCQNNGTCHDGINNYTCLCEAGFTGKYCEHDVNECNILNGGCRELCTNTLGSYTCSCQSGLAVNTDGTCPGKTENDVFHTYDILNKFLPKGCFHISFLTCPAGNIDIELSSTSHWYISNDMRTRFTSGIVFMEINNLSIPFSIAGAEIIKNPSEFRLSYKTHHYGKNMTISDDTVQKGKCVDLTFDRNELLDFTDAGSILKTLFNSLLNIFPNWLEFHHYNGSIIDMQDLKTDLKYGNEIKTFHDCTGAPVIPNRLYAVFRFGSEFSFSIYDNQIHFPSIIKNEKFCLIVDICHDYGGSAFLMVPEETRDILLHSEIFQTLYQNQHLRIRPRGIGLSFVNGVYVRANQSKLQLWNGDRMFQYSLSSTANMWIGGDLIYDPLVFEIRGSVDIYASVPNVNRMLTALFYDEWNAFIRTTGSAGIKFNMHVFGRQYTIKIPLGNAAAEAVMSLGGQKKRTWCGDISNPPGIFLATKLSLNPFYEIPILRNFVFDFSVRAYVFLMTDPGSSVSPNMHIDIIKDVLAIQNVTNDMKFAIIGFIKNTGNVVSKSLSDITNDIQNKLQTVQEGIQSILNALLQNHFYNAVNLIADLWENITNFERMTQTLKTNIEQFKNNTLESLNSFLNQELNKLEKRVSNVMKNLFNQILGTISDLSGLGLKCQAELRVFHIKIAGVDLEMVYSSNALMQCSRFNGVKELLKGQPALRFLGTFSTTVKLCPFIRLEVGSGLGMAFALRSNDSVIQMHSYVKLLGIKVTRDVYLYKDTLQLYIEGNVWGVFFAHIDVTSHLTRKWPALHVHGILSVKSRKKQQIQTNTDNFEDSYLDGMRKIISNIADGARQRLSQAQHGLTVAQNKLTDAQTWLESKKVYLRGANSAFDKAVKSMGFAKQKLENAKGPFQRAIEKLNSAQRKVDNLCRIRSCGKVCIPGIKCKICWKKVWFVKFPYPCCHLTHCMISFPDPLCLLANVGCSLVRRIAYVALEVAKGFVRLPMIALDVAKLAVSAAQIVVDKSRIVLKVAEVAFDAAEFGLELAKKGLDVAKVALESLKAVIGIAAKVLDSVIRYGLQSILDVRNCQFTLELLGFDKELFDVSCEVNAFHLGWRKFEITINFKNVLQSLWKAARATIDAILDSFGHLFSGRRKRDITFQTTSAMHILIRKIRTSNKPLNETYADTESAINETIRLSKNCSNAFEERKMIFEANCMVVKQQISFFEDTLNTLHEIATESKSSLDVADKVVNDIDHRSSPTEDLNLTANHLGINIEYAKHYNLSADDIHTALKNAEPTLQKDKNIQEVHNMTQFSKDHVKSEMQSMDLNQITNAWIAALENITKLHFNESECVGFSDCVLLSISRLYDIFSVDDHANITAIRHILIDIENDVLGFVQNSSYNIYGIHNITAEIKNNIHHLKDLNIFCSKPPAFLSQLRNVSTMYGNNATFFCRVDSDPTPSYWWYRDEDLIPGQNDSLLTITNITETTHAYRCVAGNVVANITSNDAFISVLQNETDVDPCLIDNGGCEDICFHKNESVECSCQHGFEVGENLMTCKDIDECKSGRNICTQLCNNTIGGYFCSCFDGYHYDPLINECEKDKDACEKEGLNCSNTAGCDETHVYNATCFCKDGYQLTDNGTACEDMDECTTGVCNQGCVNTDGGYNCTCFIGFELYDTDTCKECDEGQWGNDCIQTCECSAASRCDPVIGCICEEGWKGDHCDQDINECEETPDICNDTMQECLNDDGFYSCVCKEGYTKTDNGTCEDIDECSWEKSPCDHICHNKEGSFTCECDPGYTLSNDSHSCVGTDQAQCSYNTWGPGCRKTCNCLYSSTCDPSMGCICLSGWRGVHCDEDINECKESMNICNDTRKKCVNGEGRFYCFCIDGYKEMANGTCTDIKECSRNPSPCSQICTEHDGGYTCGCYTGFRLAYDQSTCIDESKSVSGCVSNCTGVQNGNYPSCYSKSEYVTCTYGIMYVNHCSTGHWNDKLKICDWLSP